MFSVRVRAALHIVSLLLVSFVPAVSQSANTSLLVGVDRRSTTSLNGDWHYLVEQPPARELYSAGGAVKDSGYAQNTHPNISTGNHNGEYDFATAPHAKGSR